jgi:thioredoxin reductase (NADPH)
VVLNGQVEIVEESSGSRQTVTIHQAGEFTGDVDMLTSRPSFVTAISKGSSETLRIDATNLRTILNQVPSLGEKFIDAFQARRELLHDSEFRGIQVIGNPRETQMIRSLLYKNSAPFTWIEPGTSDFEDLPSFLQSRSFPVVWSGEERVLENPTLLEVAESIGIKRKIPNQAFDLVIVGAGPAGLAAAVYSASEGLSTLIVDRLGPGGQAGTTSKIENFIGFPSGLSGGEFASRAYLQILKFGGLVSSPVCVNQLGQSGELLKLELDDGSEVISRCVLIASGVQYRKLIPGIEKFENAGVYYSATQVESRVCRNKPIAVVGAGNSAGQAAMFLSEHANSVRLLIRGDDIEKSMSLYLADRIRSNPGIEIFLETEVTELHGEDYLEQITILRRDRGQKETFDCAGLFPFIGALPNTDWLPESVELDERGYVKTGSDARTSQLWKLSRDPYPLETTHPGVFAAGDVRGRATRRVAFASGDGALAVSCVHQYRSKPR